MTVLELYSIFPAPSKDEGVAWQFRYAQEPNEFVGPHYVYNVYDKWELTQVEGTSPATVEWWNYFPELAIDFFTNIHDRFTTLKEENAMIDTSDICGYQVDWRVDNVASVLTKLMQRPFDRIDDIRDVNSLVVMKVLTVADPFYARRFCLKKLIFELSRYAHDVYGLPMKSESDSVRQIASQFDAADIRRLARYLEDDPENQHIIFTRPPELWVSMDDVKSEFEQIETRIQERHKEAYITFLGELVVQMLEDIGIFRPRDFEFFSPAGTRLPVLDIGQEWEGKICLGIGTCLANFTETRFYIFQDDISDVNHVYFGYDILGSNPNFWQGDETLVEPGNVVRPVLQNSGTFIVSWVNLLRANLTWQTGDANYNRLLLKKVDRDIPVEDVPLVSSNDPVFKLKNHTVAMTSYSGNEPQAIDGHILLMAKFDGYQLAAVRTRADTFWCPLPLLETIDNEELYHLPSPPPENVVRTPVLSHTISTNMIAAGTVGLFVLLILID